MSIRDRRRALARRGGIGIRRKQATGPLLGALELQDLGGDRLRAHVMAENTVTTDDRSIADLIGGETPVLVDFWAEWCGPCKMMERPLDELAGEKVGQLTVAKLNVDDNPQTAMTYEVMSIPTMILFQGGQEKKRFVGARSKGQLETELSDYIG